MQLTLNLRSKLTTGKKTARFTIPCSEEFLEWVDKVAAHRGQSRAEFGYEAALEKMKESIGEIFMAELHADKKLGDLL